MEDRCQHGMFFSGAGACPQCGGGASPKVMDNRDRAEAARNVLTYFCELVPNDDGNYRALAIDLICNIKHLFASEGIDYLSVLDAADGHFEAEAAGEGKRCEPPADGVEWFRAEMLKKIACE